VSPGTLLPKLANECETRSRYRAGIVSRLKWIPLLLLLGCDTGERLEGVERVTSTLKEGLLAANEEAESLRTELDAANENLDRVDADRKALEERVQTLEDARKTAEEKIEQLEQALAEAEPAAPAVAPGRPDPTERYKVPVGKSASRGPDDAKVTLVMITDFQCPFCKRVQPTLKALERKYGGDLRIVVKHNPLPMHARARAAALAAEAAAEQDKFWELHDLLYENSRALSDAEIRKWAKKAGCETGRFKTDLSASATRRRVDADIELARKVGARGTPAFFINGRYLAGAQPQTKFEAVINEELDEADRRIAGGTPQGSVYETLMREAKSGV